MTMETFSLIDDQHQSDLRTDLTPHEIFKTRLVRVDCQSRPSQDPLQQEIHKASSKISVLESHKTKDT